MIILELAIAFFAGIILSLDRGMAHMCWAILTDIPYDDLKKQALHPFYS